MAETTTAAAAMVTDNGATMTDSGATVAAARVTDDGATMTDSGATVAAATVTDDGATMRMSGTTEADNTTQAAGVHTSLFFSTHSNLVITNFNIQLWPQINISSSYYTIFMLNCLLSILDLIIFKT